MVPRWSPGGHLRGEREDGEELLGREEREEHSRHREQHARRPVEGKSTWEQMKGVCESSTWGKGGCRVT